MMCTHDSRHKRYSLSRKKKKVGVDRHLSFSLNSCLVESLELP